MVQYRLTYFDLRIYGEGARWMLAAAGASWEDVRLPYKQKEWFALKPRTPFGQLPILETDGIMLGQARAINRFLAKRFGFAGKNDIEDAQMDMIVDGTRDMIDAVAKYIWFCESEEEMEAAGKVWHARKDQHFQNLERILKANGGGDGYFVGDRLSYADIALAVYLPYAEGFDPASYPKLAALKERVESHPGIAEWIRTRPEGDYEKSLYNRH